LRAGTRLAVFNACNSGFWAFVRPFLRAGIPTVIGVQGSVSNLAALNFAVRLYKSIAVGLSLDEALTYARLYVVKPGRSYYECDWGRFMAYIPPDTAVLFPRTTRKAIQQRQHQVRVERESAVHDVVTLAQQMDGAGVSQILSDIAQRNVLILGRFTDERKVVLDAIKKALAHAAASVRTDPVRFRKTRRTRPDRIHPSLCCCVPFRRRRPEGFKNL